MTKVRTINFGVDTPDDHGPAAILAAMGVPSLVEETYGLGFAARVLFRPSFHPEVCVTVRQMGDEATVSLVTLQSNLWYWRSYEMQVANGTRARDDRRPREPERWEETQPVPPDRFAGFTEGVAALRAHEEQPDKGLGLDGMTVFCWYHDTAGQRHDFQFWFRDPDRARPQFVRQVHALAIELLHEEGSVRVLESLHGYLHLGLPVKHEPGHPYVLRIFGGLSSTHIPALETSLKRVPEDVPLLLDFSNFDGMGTLLYKTFRELLRRSGTTVCWTIKEHARKQLDAIGVPAGAIFATREEALTALGARDE